MLGGTWGTCVQAAAAQLLQLPEQKRVLETQQENSFGVDWPPTLLCAQRFRIQVWLVAWWRKDRQATSGVQHPEVTTRQSSSSS